MINRILKSILTVAIIVHIASLLIITSVLYRYFGGMQVSQLKDGLSLVASAMDQLGEVYLEVSITTNTV